MFPALLLAPIHPTSGKETSPKCISTILHSLPLWEQRMAYFHALESIARHKLWEQ
jgi:hypothetical protein